MKFKSKILVGIFLIIFFVGGYFFFKPKVKLTLTSNNFNHKAYSLVAVDEFFARVDETSVYDKLDIFINYNADKTYNIKSEQKEIYTDLNVSLESEGLVPVTKEFKIIYVVSKNNKSIEKTEEILLVDEGKVVLYDSKNQKVNNDFLYQVESKADLSELLNFKGYLLRFGQKGQEVDLDYNHNINIEKDGDYILKVLSKENNFSQKVNVRVKKLEENKEDPTENKPTETNNVTGKLNNINVLVNKDYHLGSGDVPDLAKVPAKYAINANYLAHPKLVASFIEMVDTMEAEINRRIIITSAYRSYQYQKDLFDRYVARDGLKAAERYSARPGQSEHQTGLAIDVSVPNDSFLNFGGSIESEWINTNAHRFGFIVRYKEGKEAITGYMPEPWHLRYLEKDLAGKVYESKLTYDEYYLTYIQ